VPRRAARCGPNGARRRSSGTGSGDAAALERVDHFLEQFLLLGERLLTAADQEHELAPGILEPLGMDRVRLTYCTRSCMPFS